MRKSEKIWSEEDLLHDLYEKGWERATSIAFAETWGVIEAFRYSAPEEPAQVLELELTNGAT